MVRDRLGWAPLLCWCLLLLSPLAVGAPRFDYTVVARYPHDHKTWTQGLIYDPPSDTLWVSGGRYGRSTLRRVELGSGRILAEQRLPRELFAEGIARVGDELFLLTWRENRLLVYEAGTLRPLRELRYAGEGWGLATLDGELVFSNGSAELSFRRPQDFGELRSVQVRDGDEPVAGLNELEVIDGAVFANVYPSSRIVRIDPRSGAVTGWLDLSGLALDVAAESKTRIDVVNGIAYDPVRRRVFVTGKLWPVIVEIASPIFEPSR